MKLTNKQTSERVSRFGLSRMATHISVYVHTYTVHTVHMYIQGILVNPPQFVLMNMVD